MHICFYRAERKQHCLLYLRDKTSNPKPCFEISVDPTCLWFHVEIRHTLGKPGAKKSPGRHQSPKWRWKHLNTWRRGCNVLYAASKNRLGIFSLGPPFLLWHTPPLQLCTHTYWSRLTGRLQNRWEKGRGHSAEANPCYYLLPSLSFASLLHSWICFFPGTGRVMWKHVNTETRRVRGKGPALLLPALWLLGQGMDIWLCISSSVKWVYISFLSMLVCPLLFSLPTKPDCLNI